MSCGDVLERGGCVFGAEVDGPRRIGRICADTEFSTAPRNRENRGDGARGERRNRGTFAFSLQAQANNLLTSNRTS